MDIISIHSRTSFPSKLILFFFYSIQSHPDYADFNCGTNSVDFKINLNDFSEMKVKIYDRNLECILAKGWVWFNKKWLLQCKKFIFIVFWHISDEINFTMLTFKLVEPMRLKWKLDVSEGTSCSISFKEFTMELCEDIDRDELQTLIEKTVR